jgi:sodium-dependent dicarboxylate transporter 2/3/5
MTVALTHLMAHTAVAATMFPLLMAINALYSDSDQPTKFGKGLFIGMAYVAGAGSIITLLGSARAAIAIAFFKEMTGKEISFFELTYYLLPLGWIMMLLIWGMMMILCKPEKAAIPGLKERAKQMYTELGGWSRNEIMTLVIVLSVITLIAAKNWVPALKTIDKTAILLSSTLLFFILNILKVEDLEDIPWNIILLFGGAMSIGFCLWQTHAAEWLAVNWLALFKEASGVVFILGIAFFVLVMTNFIMNVAAIAISLPVALVIAPYLGVAGEVIFYASLATAGMPFFLLIGAAPNAIAYNSKQFTAGEFFRYGIMASMVLMFAVWVMVTVVWPLMGLPILQAK